MKTLLGVILQKEINANKNDQRASLRLSLLCVVPNLSIWCDITHLKSTYSMNYESMNHFI